MKKMKCLFIVVALFMSGVLIEAQSLKLDSKKSVVEWTGKKVTGKHYGKISFTSGSLTQLGSSYSGGEFVVDMNSITCEDLTDPETNSQLVGHLKSDDFFGVKSFSTAKLAIKSGTLKGNDRFEFTGDLTIKGTTHPVKFVAVLIDKEQGVGFSGKLVVDRSKYDIRYGSGSFFQNLGDNMIYDEFELDFKVFFAR